VSDGKDGTVIAGIELPYLQKMYRIMPDRKNIKDVHLPDEAMIFGINKRTPLYESSGAFSS